MLQDDPIEVIERDAASHHLSGKELPVLHRLADLRNLPMDCNANGIGERGRKKERAKNQIRRT